MKIAKESKVCTRLALGTTSAPEHAGQCGNARRAQDTHSDLGRRKCVGLWREDDAPQNKCGCGQRKISINFQNPETGDPAGDPKNLLMWSG